MGRTELEAITKNLQLRSHVSCGLLSRLDFGLRDEKSKEPESFNLFKVLFIISLQEIFNKKGLPNIFLKIPRIFVKNHVFSLFWF